MSSQDRAREVLVTMKRGYPSDLTSAVNLGDLQKKLMAAARSNPPSDAVPYAFEKRIMARLPAYLPPDVWALWSRALGRAAVACLIVTLLTGAWSVWAHYEEHSAAEFSEQFETAVFVMADQADETW